MRADVCLLLEGGYPYVAGGVSTWVQQILESMPDITFSILHIGPKRSIPRAVKYKIPRNVLEIQEVFVHDYPLVNDEQDEIEVIGEDDWRVLGSFCARVGKGQPCDIASVLPVISKFRDTAQQTRSLSTSKGAWEVIREQYCEFAPKGISFLEYFWTFRFINIPVLNLLRTRLPRARIYHAACTGYAGLLGAKAAITQDAPFLLTEHGIYTRERRIEIFNAKWIRDLTTRSAALDLRRNSDYFKEWWVRLFLSLSRTAYNASDRILTLFEANRRDQINDGAPAEKLSIIPNGIDFRKLSEIPLRTRSIDEPLHIGFVGRIVSIKDVKTLIRALAMIHDKGINFQASLCGPTEEEEDYAQECLDLISNLGISEHVHFEGRVDIETVLPKFDVVVLTSISEGLPFSILEANASGIPVIATDVGACSELINGLDEEDQSLGPSGLLTRVATPSDTAEALMKIAQDPEFARTMGAAGRERVRIHYDIKDIMGRYWTIYEWHRFASPGRVFVETRSSRRLQRAGMTNGV